jgi:RNA exonuclease 4
MYPSQLQVCEESLHQAATEPNHFRRSRSESNADDSVSDSSSSNEQNVGKTHRTRRRRKRKKTKHSLPAKSDFIALDCEMVGVGPGGYSSSAARVTIIDWYGNVLLDEYIQQTEPVTDYRTYVSGITEQDLSSKATMTLDECRFLVVELLQSRILVGHALKNDLRALGVTHPWWLIRDTAKYEPFMQVRFDDGILWPRKLKELVKERLSSSGDGGNGNGNGNQNYEGFQTPGQPHCPLEDAWAALDLYKSVQTKWERVIQYKVERTNQITKKQQQEQQLTQ